MIQFNDKEMCVIFIVLLFAFKMFDVNVWKYDMLRAHHSKNYIQSNYVGLGEWTFFTKSFKEIGIVLPIVNILVILIFIAQAAVLLLAFRHLDIKQLLAVLSVAFMGCCVVTTGMIIHNYSALGIGFKGNSVNYGERVITAIVFTAIIAFFAYMNCRGVLF